MPLEFDRSILGREFDRADAEPVTAESLIAFARALGETTPCYVEPGPDLIGHPTYCVRYRSRKFLPDDLPAGLNPRMSLDAGKDIEFGVPIRPGDMVRVVSTLHDVYEKTGRTGTMIFLVVRFMITNDRDEHLATIDNRMMFKGDR
ncbi:MAG TPA: MaoC family dehydratase N-terminal domain-containing protein [Candidatus Binatia bacterium]|jgi:hydroxyacyl-ACP dehydratase HTD2-like protein with hotdog domain|nr:MaoC family dehydratase N-terminal domain-containing protein [Candidatus Binatia bacterium]